MSREITCVTNGADEFPDCRGITSLGYVDDFTGRQGMATPEEAYRDITEEGITYYISLGPGRRVKVIPVERDSIRYVRTERNTDTAQDWLLKKPTC